MLSSPEDQDRRAALALLRAESAEAVLERFPCGVVTTLPDGAIADANATFLEWTGYTREALIGSRMFQDLLTAPGRLFYEAHVRPVLLAQGFVDEVACHIAVEGGEPLPVLISSRVSLDAVGRPFAIRTAVFRTVMRTRYETQLRQARARADQLAALVQSAPDAIIRLSVDGVVETWNPAAEAMFGLALAETVGRPIIDCLGAPADAPELAAMRQAVSDAAVQRFEAVRPGRDGAPIHVSATIAPILDSDGDIAGLLLVYRDISQRKRAEEHLSLLMQEMNHRAKNVLSVVQAIALNTARTGEAATFIDRFQSRLMGLAANQDLLVRNAWRGVEMSDLVDAQLAAFAGMGESIVSAGPSMRLLPAAAQAIGLVLHELSTNAVKYGALSAAGGRVDIAWTLDRPNGTFSIDWVEGGGPEVAAPPRTGFGSTVVRKMAQAATRGEVEHAFDPSGVRWRMTAPTAGNVEG